MAVVYGDAVKTARMQMVADLVANKYPVASTGTALAGKIILGTSATQGGPITTQLAILTLSPSVGEVYPISPVTLVFAGMPLSTVGIADGVANSAEIQNASGDVIISGLTVGTFGANIVLTSTTIVTDQPVQMKSGTIKHG